MQYQSGSGGRAVSLDWHKHRELDELAALPGWRGALFKWLDLLLGAGRLLAFLLCAAMLLVTGLLWLFPAERFGLPAYLVLAAFDAATLATMWFLLPSELRGRSRHAWLTRLLIVFDRFEAKLLDSRSQWQAADMALLDRTLGGLRGAAWVGAVLLAGIGVAALTESEEINRFLGVWFLVSTVLALTLLIGVNTWFGYRKYRNRMGRWFFILLTLFVLVEIPELLNQYRALRAGDAQWFGPDRIGAHVYAVTAAVLFLLVMAVVALLRNREHEAHLARLTADAERERLAHQLTASQLKLLQAQIEPHFLFNTLGAVQQLAEGKSPEAASLTSSLIHFLRGSMGNLRADVTDLGAEKRLISAYLDIMKARMGRRLDYGVDIPAALMGQPVPPTMLITLVENAIKHGLEPKPSGGRVDVSARVDGGRLILTVADTGRGFSDIGGTGVGLANIRERLALTYGERAELELEENEPEGFVARIAIALPENPLPVAG